MKSRIYIDLDSILDTRLGTISKLYPERAIELLGDAAYYMREENVFEGVDKALFDTAYAKRDKETLSSSTPTAFLLELRKIVFDVLEKSVHPLHGDVDVTINVYPYKLTEDEKKDIEACVLYYTGECVPVRTIDLMPSLLTPVYFKGEFSVAIMYDFGTWLESQAEAFRTIQIPDVSLLVPKFWLKGKPTPEEFEEETVSEEEPFIALEMLAVGCVGLELCDPKLWSTIPPEFG